MIKLKLPTLFITLSLLTACNSSVTTVREAPKTPEAAAPVPNNDNAWQQAYGETQDQGQNKLPDVAPLDIDLKKLVQPEPAPITDLWQRIRDGYAIPQPELHADTQKQLAWFVKHPEYMGRVVERARPYLYHIVEQIEQRNMPMEVALLPVVESGFQPFAYSHGRASGLWQFIPGTGKVYGLKQNWWYDGRRDVIQSTRAALDYLEKLHNDFGDWQLALAAYNCGEGTVGRAIKKNIKAGKKTDFWSLDLPKETSAYVPKLMAVTHLIQDPEKYELTLNPIDNTPFLTVVDVGTQMDLALAAKLAEISTEEMYQLNPGFNQWATTPDGPHSLVVPIAKAEIFQKGLAALPSDQRVQWTRHKIQTGESLGIIAQHYKTTMAVLKEANGLGSNTIRAGRHLLIPIASGKPSDYPLTVSQRLTTRQNAPQRGDKKIHTVKVGDTWWDIANNYKVGVRQLTKWNNKAPADTLHLGQKLVIWTKGKSKSLNDKIRTINYKIRSGDSLWKISKKFKVSVAEVREWNGLSERTLLKPGQNLTLHIDVTRQHSSI